MARTVSAATRKKLSRAAKARPRTKSGAFKKGGAKARRKPSKRKKSAKPRRVKRTKVAARRASSSTKRKPAKRNRKGQYARKPGSKPAPRRRVRDNPAPAAFPLDLAVLNPAGPDLGQVAKLGAGVAAGMVAGSAALHFSGQSGILGDAIKAGTPIALGYGVARLGAPNGGHGMMAYGAAAAVVLTAARLLKMSPVTREYGHKLAGLSGNGATLFLQDEQGRVFVQGADGQLFRLSGMGAAGSDPLVSVMLDNGAQASMEMLGRLESGESGTVAVLRDPRSRELSVMSLSGIVEGSDQFADQALAGIVEASDQYQDQSISGIVEASDQYSDRSLSGVVRSTDQFMAGGSEYPAESDAEYY